MINIPFENEITSPLQDLLVYNFILDILILILILILIIVIFNRYIYSLNLNLINNLISKYIPIKFRNWFNKYLKTGIDYNNKFVLIMLVVIAIWLILIILLKMMISS